MGGKKNVHGGAGHKKFARKHNVNNSSKNNRLKIAEDELEKYGIATKMLGNNMFHVHCIDNVVRLCHIRGKFTGRSKRDNMVELGKWVLVGLREWKEDKSQNKMQQSDLLEVYNDLDKQRLRECVNADWFNLENNDVTKETLGFTADTNIIFGTDQDFNRDRFIEEMNSAGAQRIAFQMDSEEIDVNDI
jgi:initiation factor 1A